MMLDLMDDHSWEPYGSGAPKMATQQPEQRDAYG